MHDEHGVAVVREHACDPLVDVEIELDGPHPPLVITSPSTGSVPVPSGAVSTGSAATAVAGRRAES